MNKLPVKHSLLIGVAFLAFLAMECSLLFTGCKAPDFDDDDDEVVEESVDYDSSAYWVQFWREETKTDPKTGITEYWKYYKDDLYLYKKINKYGQVVYAVDNYEYIKNKYPEFTKKPEAGK